MSRLNLSVELGGDVKRLCRATEHILELLDQAGYIVTSYGIQEEEQEDGSEVNNISWE